MGNTGFEGGRTFPLLSSIIFRCPLLPQTHKPNKLLMSTQSVLYIH